MKISIAYLQEKINEFLIFIISQNLISKILSICI
jgi:hypothetical protein